jgi:uncharacterized protein
MFIHLAGAFEAWAGVKGPKKMIVMETEWITGPQRPWRDHQDIILRWYDHWLKGNDTGMMEEPPITLLIKGRNPYRQEYEWPLARTRWTSLFLGANQTLSETMPPEPGTVAFRNDPNILPNKPAQGLDFATSVLQEDLEVTGPVALYLWATLTEPEATWIVTIRNRAPDGSQSVVTKGWLRASHRAIDSARSTSAKPYHPHRESIPVPIGELQNYAIDLRETSMVFKKGHQLVVEIRGQDTQIEEPFWYHQCNPIETEHELYLGGEHASYLLLPVIDA